MWVVQSTPEAPMLSGSEEEASPRRPFEFITSMFKRRREQEASHEDQPSLTHITLHGGEGGQRSWTHDTLLSPAPSSTSPPPPRLSLSPKLPSGATPGVGGVGGGGGGRRQGEGGGEGGGVVHHTPIKARDIGIDMEAIRLSRQDNPYLQRVADSQTTLTEEEEAAEAAAQRQREDRARLVAQQESQEGALSLSEVHEHLIRSPPPTSLPRTLPTVFLFPHDKDKPEGGAPPPLGGRSQPLNPLVTRQHADVLDHHLRQILHTQRQLVVAKSRPGDVGTSCSSVPASPARNLARRSPHSRTLSEEATVVQGTGAGPGSGAGESSGGVGSGGSLAPVLPPGRRQHSSTDILLHPTNNPPTRSGAHTPTPTPPILKPISSKPKRGSVGGGGSSNNEVTVSPASLRLPIRYPNQPAPHSSLVDIT